MIARLDKASHAQTQSERHVQPMDITGKVMKGWARVGPAGIRADADLKTWVDRAVKYAWPLPPK